MFDAYTIKKVLPRLVIAVILIQLSWPLITTLINVINQVSWGLEGLMYLPFGGRDALDIGVTLEKAGGGGTFAGLLLGGGAYLLAGAPGALALAVGILVALVVAFFTLAIRQIIIIALVLTAPLALVAWILPNTEGFFKFWWSTLSKALLMYPIILLLVAAGRIGAHLVVATDLPSGVQTILAIIIFFAPLCLISKTFQYAGGAIGAVANVVGSKGSKITGYMGKRSMAKQGAKYSALKQRADENRLFNPQGRFGKYNDVASSLVNPKAAAQIKLANLSKKTGRSLPGSRTGAAIMGEIGQKKWDSTQKLASVLSSVGMNDQALGALTSWDGSQKNMNEIISGLESSGNQAKIDAAQQLRNNSGFLYSTFKSEEYGRASIAGAAGLAKASQGFTNGTEIANLANTLNEESPGLGDTFKTQAELLGGKAGALTKPGSTTWFNRSTGEWEGAESTSSTRMSHLKKIGVGDIGTSKGLTFSADEKKDAEGKPIAVGNRLGDSFVHALSGQSNDVSEAEILEMEGTLANAYASYTNPSVRGQVRRIFEESEQAKASLAGRTLSDSELSAIVDGKLGKGRAMSADEIAAQQAALGAMGGGPIGGGGPDPGGGVFGG